VSIWLNPARSPRALLETIGQVTDDSHLAQRILLAHDSGTLKIVGVQLPQFVSALRTAALDEVFVIYDAMRREGMSQIPRQRLSTARRGGARPVDQAIS
jgi:hypothetical protein